MKKERPEGLKDCEMFLQQSAPQAKRSLNFSTSKVYRSSNEVISPQSLVLSEILSDVLDKGADCKFHAKGQSMSPFIKDGDMLTVSPLTSSPRFGDIVASLNPETERLAIHRVVGKRKNAYLIKGDNSSEADGLFHRENIFGSVTYVEREGRKVTLGLGSERFLIAFFSRWRLLSPLISSLWKLFRPFARGRD